MWLSTVAGSSRRGAYPSLSGEDVSARRGVTRSQASSSALDVGVHSEAAIAGGATGLYTVSYTHLTLPTNREV